MTPSPPKRQNHKHNQQTLLPQLMLPFPTKLPTQSSRRLILPFPHRPPLPSLSAHDFVPRAMVILPKPIQQLVRLVRQLRKQRFDLCMDSLIRHFPLPSLLGHLVKDEVLPIRGIVPRRPILRHVKRAQERACGENGAGLEVSGVDQGDAGVLAALQALPACIDQAFEEGGGG